MHKTVVVFQLPFSLSDLRLEPSMLNTGVHFTIDLACLDTLDNGHVVFFTFFQLLFFPLLFIYLLLFFNFKMNGLSYIYSQSDLDVSVSDSAFYFLNKRKQKNIDKLMLVLFFKYKKNNID